MSICLNCGHSSGVHPNIEYGQKNYTGQRCFHVMSERDRQTGRRHRCPCKEYKPDEWDGLLKEVRREDGEVHLP